MNEEIPSSKFQVPKKLQWTSSKLNLVLAIGIWGFFGIWSLEFGSSAASAAELPRGFVAETLVTNLNASTAMAVSPDGRIFLNDQTGKLLVWKNGALLPQPALTLHVTDYWERGLDGVVLHPDFPKTPHIFLLYVTDKPFVHHVISRFTMNGDVVDPASEKILFEGDNQATLGGSQPGGHQGGPMRFGHDGKLYVCIGEQTAGEPSQRLNTLQGKILRLNADGSIPEDNPFFAKTTGKYRAIYAYGVRNAFGLAVQPKADGGRMFFTDVGGSAFEEVNELVPGANYGWPKAEGYSTQPEFKSPLYAYPPMIGQCICGGTFYPSAPDSTFPAKWRGKFFFVDFMKHWMKALDPNSPANVITFAKGFNGPIAVEVTPDGSLLVLERGTIWRDPKKFVPNSGSLVRIKYTGETPSVSLTQAPKSANPVKAALGLPMDASALPKRISESEVNPIGIQSIRLNSPPWNPGVEESVYIALPSNGNVIRQGDGSLHFPDGTVLMRTFVLPLPKSDFGKNAVEMRLVVFGTPYGYGASYLWRADHSDADLVEDGEFGEIRPKIQWFFPGLDDRLAWPTPNVSFAFPLTIAQLNVGSSNNALLKWNMAGRLEPALDDGELERLPKAASVGNAQAASETRVRSYLDANCAVCHQPGGAARALFDARFSTPLAKTGLLNGELAAGDLGIAGAKVIVPGSPDKSILYQRLKRTDFFRMPPIQYHNETSPILPVMAEWIQSLKSP